MWMQQAFASSVWAPLRSVFSTSQTSFSEQHYLQLTLSIWTKSCSNNQIS